MNHVLIVEDQEDHAWMLSSILTKMHFLTSTTTSIFYILEQVISGKIFAIVLDMYMPEISGYDILKIVRKKDPTIPIIMVTAQVDEGLRSKCLQLGANYYFTKPLNNEDFKRVFNNLLDEYNRNQEDQAAQVINL